jgi:hypothetical protein
MSVRVYWAHTLAWRSGQRRIWSVGLAHHARRRCYCAAGADAVFANNLLECRLKNLPWEHLDILLNVAGLGVRKAHDDLEELFAVRLSLGHCLRMESFQVTTDAVLLFNTEAIRRCNKLLEKINSVDRCDITLALLSPPDTRDADTVGWSIVHAY